ncbi:MAG: hypothetical protein R3E86_14945 [Pseudomonadales bacterium]
MTDQDDQSWFDGLYQTGPQDKPPPDLDTRIRAAAREPAPGRAPRHYARWAAAAAVVLAAAVLLRLPPDAGSAYHGVAVETDRPESAPVAPPAMITPVETASRESARAGADLRASVPSTPAEASASAGLMRAKAGDDAERPAPERAAPAKQIADSMPAPPDAPAQALGALATNGTAGRCATLHVPVDGVNHPAEVCIDGDQLRVTLVNAACPPLTVALSASAHDSGPAGGQEIPSGPDSRALLPDRGMPVCVTGTWDYEPLPEQPTRPLTRP